MRVKTPDEEELFRKQLGLRLKQLREKEKMSRSQLGVLIDKSRPTIEYYEKGKRNIDALTVYKLAKVFNVSADYIISGIDGGTALDKINTIAERTDKIAATLNEFLAFMLGETTAGNDSLVSAPDLENERD